MTRRSRHLAAALLTGAALSGAAVPVLAQSSSPGQASATGHAARIQADNFRFCNYKAPSCSTTSDTNHKTHVLVNQRIKWIYKDTACDTTYLCPGHNVTFAHRHSAGDTHTQGGVIFTTVFHKAGTYNYYCTHHKSQGMTGRIVVTTH